MAFSSAMVNMLIGKRDQKRAAARQQAEGSGGGGARIGEKINHLAIPQNVKEDVEAQWELAPGRMEVGRWFHSAAVHGGTMCAVGGSISGGTVAVYDAAAQVWNELPGGGMARVRTGNSSAMYKDKLYVVGGYIASEVETLRSVEVYDFVSQQWSFLPTEMVTARSSSGAVVCEDKLYVVGGRDGNGNTIDSGEVYDFATKAWSILPAPMPHARTVIGNKVLQHKGKVYVVGGYRETVGWLQSVAVYDIATEAWSVLPAEMMLNRRFFAAAVHGNTIYVLGGMGEKYNAFRNVEVYDIAVGEWSMMSAEMQVARNMCAAAVHEDDLYIVGGRGTEAVHTMERIALPSLLPFTPARHSTFPHSFKRAVFTLVHCFARTNALPDAVLFKIIWLLLRSAFKQPTLA
jgi:hypothetical protein